MTAPPTGPAPNTAEAAGGVLAAVSAALNARAFNAVCAYERRSRSARRAASLADIVELASAAARPVTTEAVEGVAEAVPLPAVFRARQPFTVPARQTA